MTTNQLPARLKGCAHHPDLWFSDGNIVLRVGFVLFKVYKGILAAKCTVFEDMLSIPPPTESSNDQDFYDSCPLVYLDEDEEEMTAFLTLLFDGMSFRNLGPPSFKESIGIMHLAHKYDAPTSMKYYALNILDPIIPYTLADFERTEPPFEFQDTIVPLAKLCEETECLDWMLPFAAYVVIATGNVDLLHTSQLNFPGMEQLQTSLIFEFGESLDQKSDLCEDISCSQHRFKYASSFKEGLTKDCLSSVRCRLGCPLRNFLEDPVVESPLDIHFTFEQSNGICEECRNAILCSIQRDREIFWDAIPAELGLISWESILLQRTIFLRKMRKECLIETVSESSINSNRACHHVRQKNF
ncbi:hypothetical protein DL96DRAFT_1823420 [Flagelloscypha sp. PMI_526]|nr:hypothetical protein DL96DRAFT_1823420 [Flagelloscypha sp. PMI_526]